MSVLFISRTIPRRLSTAGTGAMKFDWYMEKLHAWGLHNTASHYIPLIRELARLRARHHTSMDFLHDPAIG